MKENKIIYYLFTAFIAGSFLLIYIQFNSSKNINNLVAANETLVNEFNVGTALHKLEKDVMAIESKIRSIITTKDSAYIEGLDININEVKTSLSQLQKISDDDSSILYIYQLDTLIQHEIHFSRQVLESFRKSHNVHTSNVAVSNYQKKLTGQIVVLINKIESIRKKNLAITTVVIDKSGKKAQRFSILLIVFVLIAAAGLFWYIISIITKQISLIRQLNISEKKVKEAATLKEKFMANMSHEIRTPMNAVLGFANLLKQKNRDNELEEYIQSIQRSGQNLLRIINDILDLSKIEAGMMRLESAPFNIRELVLSIEIMFKNEASEKEIKLSTSVAESIPEWLEGDATRLAQILVNLVGNALKFTDAGSIVIQISNLGIMGDIIKTGVTVSDTGIGIDKEKIEHIFDRFQQAEDSVTRKYGGTGLGLSIVKDLVLMQHGSIEAKSEIGNGTTFIIAIPYKISVGVSQPDFPKEISLNNQANFANKSILVAEDNEINQSLIKHIFSNWQLKFDLAGNGMEVLALLHQNKYDLILMDIQMPEMDGYTTTKKIRNHLQLSIPIIAMTAHVLYGEKEKCLSVGMNAYISKPIIEPQLYQLIVKYTNAELPITHPTKESVNASVYQYQYINLGYMKEVSNGNCNYEKAVTEQFIEAIPLDLKAMENAWQLKSIEALKQLAHNMKTTISIMGLTEILQHDLDILEYNNLDEETFNLTFLHLQEICNASVSEALHFYQSL